MLAGLIIVFREVLEAGLIVGVVAAATRGISGRGVFIAGGVAAGVRAVEHLAHSAIEMEMVPLRNTVLIPNVANAFDPEGEPVDPATNIALGVTLDDLEWWGSLLARGRAEGELAPGTLRARAAMAQLAEER